MKIVVIIARYLLGLVFFVFGLNGFLHFIPAQLPPGLAGQFLGAMLESKYVYLVSGVQVIGAVLLLANRFVPLGVILLGAEIVNILVFHLTMQTMGLGTAFVLLVLWLLIAYSVRGALAPLFESKVSPQL